MKTFTGNVMLESQKQLISSPCKPLCAWLAGQGALNAANDVAWRAVA
jgi:hypothetical protein